MENDLVRRIAVTVGVVALWYAGTRLPVPGIDDLYLQLAGDLAVVSVMGLGAAPLLTGFLLVEIVAFAVPAWRPWIRGGPAEREVLWRAGVVVGLGLAAVQALAMTISMEAMTIGGVPLVLAPGSAFRATTVVAMVAGAASVTIGARFVDDHGLGNGFAVLVAAETVGALFHQLVPLPMVAPAALLLDVVPAVIAAALVLRWSVPPYPTWGAAWPVGFTLALVGFGAVGIAVPPWTAVAPLLLGAAVLTWAARPIHRVAAVGAPDRSRFEERVAIARANRLPVFVRTLLLAALLSAPALRPGGSALVASLLPVVLVVAVMADLADELRARGAMGRSVAAWPLHQPYLVRPALAALEAAGIRAAVRGARYRALFGPFDPRVAIDVLVPADRREEAVRVLTDALEVRVPGPDAAPGAAVPVGPPGQPWEPPASGTP